MRKNKKRSPALLLFIVCLAGLAVLYIVGRPASYVWVMDRGDLLLTLDVHSRAYMVGMNLFDGTIWVGIDDRIIRYDENGIILGSQTGFNKPHSIAFARSGDDLSTEIQCTISFYADRFTK